MKTLFPKTILFSMLCIFSLPSFSQSSTDYVIEDETWTADNHEVTVSCKIMTAGNASLPVAVSSDAIVDLRSSNEIHLRDGFSARQFSSTGYFHAQCIPSFDNLLVDYTARGPICFGEEEGNLEVRAMGGGGIYEYSLDEGDFSSTSSWTNLSVGIHTLDVRDNLGNTTSLEIEVPPVDLTYQASE